MRSFWPTKRSFRLAERSRTFLLLSFRVMVITRKAEFYIEPLPIAFFLFLESP